MTSHSSSARLSRPVSPHVSRAATALLLAAFASSAKAVDYYKGNNTTNFNANASWVDLGGAALGTTPTNTSSSPDTWYFDSRVQILSSGNPPVFNAGGDLGVRNIVINDPGYPITIDGGAKTLTIPNGGTINLSNATQDLTLQNYGSSSTTGLRMATSSSVLTITVPTGRTFTMAGNTTTTVASGSSNATVNISGGGRVVFNGDFRPSHLNLNYGTVEFNRAGGNSRIAGTGTSTTIGGNATNTATILINNTSGNALGSGNATIIPVVNINANGILGGNGTTAGVVTANADSTLTPGVNGVGSLKFGSLNLTAGSKITWEANTSADADLITTTNALTLSGGNLSLYNPGTTNPLTALGTFNLISYGNSTFTGAANNLTINPDTKVEGRIYTLANSGTAITLTIATEAAIERSWDVDESNTWSTAASWTADTIPDATGTIANISGPAGVTFTAPRTITLDAPRTVGTLSLSSAQSVTLDGNSTLTLNNNAAAANLISTGADHLVSTPLALTAGGVLADVAASTTLTLGGVISGDGFGIGKSGNGTLLLTANNTYTALTSVAGGTLQIGDGGTSGWVSGNITTNGVLRFNLSGSTAPGLLAGSGQVQFTGTGDTTLSFANTYSGNTTLSAGTLILANANALQNSTLTYSSTGGSLSVADTVTSLNLGGLAGDRALPSTNTLGTPLAITVGANGASTTYSGSPLGTGASLTKTGFGTLTLTGAHAYTGNTTVNSGILSLDAGSSLTTTSATTTGGSSARIVVNGGNLTVSGTSSLISNITAGLLVSSGTANFSGNIVNETNSSSGAAFISATGGTLNAASIALCRGATPTISSEPTSGQTANGLYVNGGTVNLTGNLSIGAMSAANSSVSGRIDTGSLTVGGVLAVGINNTSPNTRWSVFDVNGGNLTCTDTTTGILLGGTGPGVSNVTLLVRNASAVVTTPRIQFGRDPVPGASNLSLSAGSLYVGSGGMVLSSSNASSTAALKLTGGTLGATADWSSTIPVTINNGPSIVTGADASDNPYTIDLQGTATGLGSLTKNGSGTVRLSSPSNNYYGPTIVNGGTLALAGSTTDLITVNTSGALTPLGLLTAESGAAINGRLNIDYNAAAPTPVSGITNTVDTYGITLGAASSLVISGTGTLTAPAYVLLRDVRVSGVTGTFATVTGVPSGYALNYAYDDDANVATPPVVALVAAPSDPYTVWADSFPTLTDRLLASDPDGDGLTNLQEYAFVTSPVTGDSADAYTFGRTGNNLTLSFDHPADASLTYEVQASENLTAVNGGWSTVNTFTPFATSGNATYTDTADLTVTPRRFLRLSVTKTP